VVGGGGSGGATGGNASVQIKGVCKESLETLMRTAAKMNQNHLNATLDGRSNTFY